LHLQAAPHPFGVRLARPRKKRGQAMRAASN
jgi:hypothetical protein